MPAEATATIDIACDAAFCWTLLADPRLASEWVLGVADAEIVELDAAGRPGQVRFTGMPSAASLDYVVAYTYDEAARRLRWRTVGEAERTVDGEAWLEPLGAATCRLHYVLTTRAAKSLPTWARDTLADDTPAKVVKAFQRFAERRAAR